MSLFNFCSCLLTSIRILQLKKKFLTWSRDFIRTNFKKHIFWLATKTICIKMKFLDHVRHDQYFQFLSCSFMTSLLPKYLKKKWCCVLNFNSSSNQNLTHAQNKHQHDYLNLSTKSYMQEVEWFRMFLLPHQAEWADSYKKSPNFIRTKDRHRII